MSNLRFGLLLSCFSALLLLGGCWSKDPARLFSYHENKFTNQAGTSDNLLLYGRICSHDEIYSLFEEPEDFYHYYYLVHLRIKNSSHYRYSLKADKLSLFLPPAQILWKYTEAKERQKGTILAFFSTLLFFPVYILNILKESITSPYFISTSSSKNTHASDKYVVLSSNFLGMTALYLLIGSGPLLIGSLYDKWRSGRTFKKYTKLITMQGNQLSIAPYKTKDILLVTPRAGFKSPVTIPLYNHGIEQYQNLNLELKEVF